jgi:hypothetical protein
MAEVDYGKNLKNIKIVLKRELYMAFRERLTTQSRGER